jgi:BirA family biotin operon repressor/biotin-[acetyl-CoA-carboxylase] ligase
VIGSPRVHRRLIGSTNAHARHLAAAGAPDGTLVTATEQSAGRGRSDRTWDAPPGSSVLMSVVLRGLGDRAGLLPLTAAVALCDVLDPWLADVAIKWPNDVWVARRKVAGILVEGRPQEDWAVLGMGINVLTEADALPEGATSIARAGAELPTVEGTLAALLGALERRLSGQPSEMLSAWRERDGLRGTVVAWGEDSGTAAGVDDHGGLLVDLPDGSRVTLSAGEVHLGSGAPAPG